MNGGVFCPPELGNVINQDKLCVAMMAHHNDSLFIAKNSVARVDKTRHCFFYPIQILKPIWICYNLVYS